MAALLPPVETRSVLESSFQRVTILLFQVILSVELSLSSDPPDIIFRRCLRGDPPFHPHTSSTPVASTSVHSRDALLPSMQEDIVPILDLPAEPPENIQSYSTEIMQTLLAGGVAGSLSAIIPYP